MDRIILYNKDGWPSCTSAREFLSQRGVAYESRSLEQADRGTTVDLARQARRLLVKVGQDTLRFDARQNPITEADTLAYLIHEDGFLRVPVLVVGDLVVRGYTEQLYREVLEEAGGW